MALLALDLLEDLEAPLVGQLECSVLSCPVWALPLPQNSWIPQNLVLHFPFLT